MPEAILLTSLQHAGWDGCYGVRTRGRACPELFVGGVIARFSLGKQTYRYHIVGDAFLATDFIDDATVDDGSPVQSELEADTVRLMAGWARGDASLRLGRSIEQIDVLGIDPVQFSSGCLGFLMTEDQACDAVIVSGAILILGSQGHPVRYHVGVRGEAVPVSFEPGRITHEADAETLAVQHAMLADLAMRIPGDSAEPSMLTFQRVTWPDGCLGVRRPGQVCTQALVPGFFAELQGADGKVYRYHGAGAEFVAVDFEVGATIDVPPRGG